MRSVRWKWMRSALVCAALLAPACRPNAPVAPRPEDTPVQAASTPTSEALVTEWTTLAEQAEAHFSDPRAIALGHELAAFGADALTPLLDVIADPGVAPEPKALALITLSEVVSPEMAARLQDMCKTGGDGTTRSCAADLLSRIPGEGPRATLQSLVADPEPRVRLAALIGLSRRGDAAARAEAMRVYRAPGVTTDQRNALLFAIVDTPRSEDRAFLSEALQDTGLDPVAQRAVTAALAQVGGAATQSVPTRHNSETSQ